MRLFCDQNIMVETVEFLRGSGHDVVSTREFDLSRADDDEVLRFAIQTDRILLTFNADFSDLRTLRGVGHSGIIRLRLHKQTAEELHPILARVFAQLTDRDLAGRLVTVKARAVRIRGT